MFLCVYEYFYVPMCTGVYLSKYEGGTQKYCGLRKVAMADESIVVSQLLGVWQSPRTLGKTYSGVHHD